MIRAYFFLDQARSNEKPNKQATDMQFDEGPAFTYGSQPRGLRFLLSIAQPVLRLQMGTVPRVGLYSGFQSMTKNHRAVFM